MLTDCHWARPSRQLFVFAKLTVYDESDGSSVISNHIAPHTLILPLIFPSNFSQSETGSSLPIQQGPHVVPAQDGNRVAS